MMRPCLVSVDFSRLKSWRLKSPILSKLLDHSFELLPGRCAAQTKPNRAHSDLWRDAHGSQHWRQPYRSGMARGTGGRGHTAQAPQNVRTDLSHKVDVECIRQSFDRMAV